MPKNRQPQKNTRSSPKSVKKQDSKPRNPKPSKENWLYGRHAVIAALTHGRRALHALWLMKPDPEAEKLAKQHPSLTVQITDKQTFDKTFPEQNHQGIALQCSPLPATQLKDVLNQPRLLMLDQITDPHNLGAILRTADAFGFGAILIPDFNSAPLSDIVAKTACGALETVPVINVGNLNQALKKLGEHDYWSVGLAGEATQTLQDFTQGKLPPKICVVMGSEGEGMRRMVRENCDELIKIPMVGTVESLNVSVATGITLAALSKT